MYVREGMVTTLEEVVGGIGKHDTNAHELDPPSSSGMLSPLGVFAA